MPEDKTKRREQIDSAIEAAEGTMKERDGKLTLEQRLAKNPYPKGSARHKLWARRERERYERGE